MVSFDTVSVPPPAAPPAEEEKPPADGVGGGPGDGPGHSNDAGDGENKASVAAAAVAPQAIPSLTQQQARAALLAHVGARCCYGSGAAKQMRITNMDYVPAFHYELQTFTEKRETSWTYAPHKGGEVDSPARGPAPLPWDIEEKPSHMFKAGGHCYRWHYCIHISLTGGYGQLRHKWLSYRPASHVARRAGTTTLCRS
jgi:hypothetical protein